MPATPSETLRRRWLDSLLPEVAFDGWTEGAAARAASAAGLSDGEQALAAPGGVRDLIDSFFDRAGEEALAALAGENLSSMRVQERVKAGVLAWLAALAPHRDRDTRSRGADPRTGAASIA